MFNQKPLYMKNKNTGLALPKARGPLTQLLTNLSGENGEFWLESLKKMLRKEELPEPTLEILKELGDYNPHKETLKKFEKIVDFLKSIPAVKDAKLDLRDFDLTNKIINVQVFYNVRGFALKKESGDVGSFSVLNDYSVKNETDLENGKADKVFVEFCKRKTYPDLNTFCQALNKLKNDYVNSVPEII